jgi:SPP1 family predicted phage head-tail adaptor
MMEVGAMRQRITIQKATVTTDEIGNRKNAWTDYHTCFAYVNLSSGKEYEAAGQTLPGDTLVFTIRWCEKLADLDCSQFRILFAGRIYNLITVDDVQFRHQRLKLTGERVERS